MYIYYGQMKTILKQVVQSNIASETQTSKKN